MMMCCRGCGIGFLRGKIAINYDFGKEVTVVCSEECAELFRKGEC